MAPKTNHARNDEIRRLAALGTHNNEITRLTGASRTQVYYALNPKSKEKKNAYNKKMRAERPEVYSKNQNKYFHANKGYYKSCTNARRGWARKNTPTLTREDHLEMAIIYDEARRITRETGVQMHVDHIVPLKLGGAHHPSNLQVITARENLRKGSKWSG